MFKRYVSIFVSLVFFLTMAPFSMVEKVQAYENASYFNNLKIGLVSMSSSSLSLVLNGEYTVNGKVYASGSQLNLKINGTSIDMNGYLFSDISLSPNSVENLITVSAGTVSNNYSGSFIVRNVGGKILPINCIDMENYLKGVVGYEMSDYFPLEALKAQSVAARNYALSKIDTDAIKGYDFDDTISYQVYKGFNPSYKNVIQAVEETKGQVLLYNDKLVEALYSAWHGGYSEDSENVWGNFVPYLRATQDSYESDPWPNGNRIFSVAQIQSTLISKGYLSSTDFFLGLDLNSITRYSSGRVSGINILYKDALGTSKVKSVTMDKARTFLSLPSNMYTVTFDSDSKIYSFSGKGYGHGLGMSQIGAKNRASAGQSYEEILKFYYKNSYLENLIVKASLASASISKESLLIGDSLSINASAISGSGYGYLYKFVIKNGTDVLLTRNYEASSSIQYVPKAPGNYNVEVYVKDKYSSLDFDDSKTLAFTAYSTPTLKVSSTALETQLNNPVEYTALPSEGSGNFKYRFVVIAGSKTLEDTGYSTSNKYLLIPTVIGEYSVVTYLKDALSENEFEAQTISVLKVNPPLAQLSEVSINSSKIFVGDSLAINASSSEDSLYKYVVYKNGSQIYIQEYNINSSFTYIPTEEGSYSVEVYVKHINSTREYDDMKSISVDVYRRPALTRYISDKSELLKGQSSLFLAESSGGNGESLYKYVVIKDTNLVTAREYSTQNGFSFTPSTSGSYEVYVYLKDTLSNREYEDYKCINLVVLKNQH